MDPLLTERLLNTNVTELKFQIEPATHLNRNSGRDSKETQRTRSYKLLFLKANMYHLIPSKILAGWHGFPEWVCFPGLQMCYLTNQKQWTMQMFQQNRISA